MQVRLLRQELEKYKDDAKKLIMFTDSYDVVFDAGADVIVERFNKFGARILFGAEGFCWPQRDLAEQYPAVTRGT